MSFTPEEEAELRILLGITNKTISDLELAPTLASDMLIEVESGSGTFSSSINNLKTFIAPPATKSIKGSAYLSNPVQVVNDGSNPNDTVGFVAGTFITSAGNQIYLPTITKKIQSTGAFTAGSGNNGLDTGARATSTFYRTFVIQNNSTLAYDILFSVSATSPTVPSGYTNLGIMDYALIRVNNSGNISAAKWDIQDKKIILGSGQHIIFANSAGGAGNVLIVNTTEKLEFGIRINLQIASTGGADFSVYGSEHDSSQYTDCVIVGSNNGFQAHGNGSVFTTDGRIYWKNFSGAGNISNQTGSIKTIKIRN